MNTKQLKAKVLDLAIHGKLLSPETVAELKKSPDYETADVLLEKIRKEKEEKIAKGELKRDKKDSYIFVGDDKRHYEKFADGNVKDIEDEIPFDVPEGWAWCQIKNLVKYIGDGDWIESKDQSDKGIRLIQTGNIGLGNFKDKEGKYHFISEQTFNTLQCNEIFESDILVSRLPEPVGRACVLPKCNYRMITAVDCTILRLNEKIIEKDFFVYYTQSNKYLELIKENCTGTTRLRISRANLEKIYVPIPPKLIQKAIVSDINKYDSTINSIENDRNDITLTINKAKSKILDLAIHGKLVPQDANDEPASVLLEKLRAEKEEKIAKGELKRDKNDSYIYKGSDNCYYRRLPDGENINITEEIPFEVPLNWTWTRIGEIASKITDGEHNTPKRVSTFQGFYLLSARNIQNGYISLNDVDYVDENEFIRIHKRCNPQKGDVLVSCSGSVGRCAVIEDDNKYVMVRSAAMISSNIINTKYLMYVIQSQELQNQIEDSSKQTAQANLFQAAIADLLIPLPPFNEQKRIVKNIEELYMKLELINQNID